MLSTYYGRVNDNAAYTLIDRLGITEVNKQNFLLNNGSVAHELFNYLQLNGGTSSTISLLLWSVDYLYANPTVTIAVFKNQFLGRSEGQDGEYDAAYWDEPNLNFTPQNLPSWSNFQAAFPLNTNSLYNTPERMYNSIGGEVATFYVNTNTNTCAVRLSKALNYSGIVIPNISGKTFKGADNKYYFIRAADINVWMRKTFGTNDGDPKTPFNANHYHYTGAQAGVHGVNLPSLLSGKKGIYSLFSSDIRWATGHADLLLPDATCGNECHFYDAPILYLDIWVLN